MSVEFGPSTAAVHAGEPRQRAHDAITTAVVHASTYTFAKSADVIDLQAGRVVRDEYGRYGNPTIRAAEAKLAALEAPQGGAAALLCPSGMNAITSTILALVPTGGHLILTDDCYRRTRQFVQTILVRLGIEHTVIPVCNTEALAAAIRPGQTSLILSEAPTNPYLRVTNLADVVAVARQHQILTLIDATFATPYNMRPLEYGIDLVVHSCTKYLGGHNDLLAGVVIGAPELIQPLRHEQGIMGAISDPQSAFLLLRGLKTFGLRMERHNQNGLAVAQFLERHPRVTHVHYPGLPSHPDHAVATAQMRGFGGVVSFEIEGDLAATAHMIDLVKIPYIAPSLGGVESLIEQPAIISYYEMTTEQCNAVGIYDNLVRFACGVEDAVDLIADLAQALDGYTV
ncbi:trans-sulfuration enzyme family protein [Candidatus Oscillochloris fontis]|uniref:trans-sulfuration enzyme family protein n=1 Tax=Candidatus Oscillochloris fontis TaxID=2496868 RepID=UPI00101D9276|nr:PLP-dependent aspartate aminotransferase family protein [Candidatus Oscillochloris fontis]